MLLVPNIIITVSYPYTAPEARVFLTQTIAKVQR